MKITYYYTVLCLLASIIMIIDVPLSADSINQLQERNLNSLPAFNVWYDGPEGVYKSAPARRNLPYPVKGLINPDHQPDRLSLIKKTYHIHHNLHFNIPLVCYKFSVCQSTCDE